MCVSALSVWYSVTNMQKKLWLLDKIAKVQQIHSDGLLCINLCNRNIDKSLMN